MPEKRLIKSVTTETICEGCNFCKNKPPNSDHIIRKTKEVWIKPFPRNDEDNSQMD